MVRKHKLAQSIINKHKPILNYNKIEEFAESIIDSKARVEGVSSSNDTFLLYIQDYNLSVSDVSRILNNARKLGKPLLRVYNSPDIYLPGVRNTPIRYGIAWSSMINCMLQEIVDENLGIPWVVATKSARGGGLVQDGIGSPLVGGEFHTNWIAGSGKEDLLRVGLIPERMGRGNSVGRLWFRRIANEGLLSVVEGVEDGKYKGYKPTNLVDRVVGILPKARFDSLRYRLYRRTGR